MISGKVTKCIKYFLFIFSISAICSCSTTGGKEINKSYSLEPNIGIYAVVSSKCSGYDVFQNPCTVDRFIEFRYGTFYGIKSTELALVFWRGDAGGGHLLYTANQVYNFNKLTRSNEKVYFEGGKLDGQREMEYIVLDKNEQLVEYNFISETKTNKRKLKYILKKIDIDEVIKYSFNYPEE